MMTRNHSGCNRAAGRQGGFTLVEILAAMSLAVLVMLGVAQVFKICSDAVSEAESLSSGYQLGRGVMTMLERDLRSFTNEGYLSVIPEDVTAPQLSGGNVTYRFDTLLFTVVGRTEDMEGSSAAGTAAEIAYTFGGRDATRAYELIATGDSDPRTMILVRKVFPVRCDITMATPHYPMGLYYKNDPSRAKGCLAFMAVDRWNLTSPIVAARAKFRIAAPARMSNINKADAQPEVTTTLGTGGSYASNVNTVVCERISEFFVEVLTGESTWHRAEPTNFAGRLSGHWGGNLKVGMASASPAYGTYKDTYMPRMIRVTAVVHPANDQKSMQQQPYAGDIPASYPRKYRGMVFRQVFTLNGVLNTK